MKNFLWVISKFQRKLPMLAGVFLFMYFSAHTVAGDRSYSHLSDLVVISEQKLAHLDRLQQERDDLEVRVRMMRPSSLSVDVLEEQASLILGYNLASDIVVVSY